MARTAGIGNQYLPVAQARLFWNPGRLSEAYEDEWQGNTKRARRDLFGELGEGVAALAEARHGTRTLRKHALEYKPAPRSRRRS